LGALLLFIEFQLKNYFVGFRVLHQRARANKKTTTTC